MREKENAAKLLNKIQTERLTAQSFGEVLQAYRSKSRVSQAALSELFGTTRNTVNNWENERSKPDYDTIRQLVQMFDIPLYELFGLNNVEMMTAQELGMLRDYRALSAADQRVARVLIETLLTEAKNTRDQQLRDTYRILPLEATPAAAGAGCIETEIPPRPFLIRNNDRSRRADALVRVSGHSMEPKYQDGDLVYVKFSSSADDGDDVVCYYTGGAIIKRMSGNRLRSLNADYPFGDKSEDDNVRIMGRVLGIVDQDEIPDAKDREALEEVLAEELLNFRKLHGLE